MRSYPDNSGLDGMPADGGAANTDGVVATFNAFGSVDLAPSGTYNAPFDKGRTMTHEVGHYLGLRHIWGDGACGVDDFCADTPASDNPNYGCATGHTSCTTVDMVENYMDYSDDGCMNIFTEDQKARVRTVMSVSPRRVELASSTACLPPAPYIDFDNGSASITEGTDCGYQDIAVNISLGRGASADATVNVSAVGGTATAGVDYELLTSSVIFTTGETGTKSITIRLYNDGVVEGAETIELDLAVTTTGDALDAGNTYTLTITDNDKAPVATNTVALLNADFESGGNGFTTAGLGTNAFGLLTGALVPSGAPGRTFWGNDGTNTSRYVISNDDDCDCDKSADYLISPIFDLAPYASATLTFDHAFSDVGPEASGVYITNDGGTNWSLLQSITNTSNMTDSKGGKDTYITPWVSGVTVDLSAYVGQSNLQIGFLYNDGGSHGYGLAIDNVNISATAITNVQETVNTSNNEQIQMRGNETIHWYDPATGNIMGTIENTSGFDYGCTSFEVDRDPTTAGAGTANFASTDPVNNLLSKTFRITPTTDNPSGTYTVTFYFTEAEIAAWETATGKNRADLKIVKIKGAPIGDVTGANIGDYGIDLVVPTIGAFGSNVTLTASFSTGFSGFGVGDPGNVPLPVELIDFDGKQRLGEVQLKWNTASEFNSDYFNLERSKNGVDFERIAQVKSAGNTDRKQGYGYLDETPFEGYNYYRLIQVDKDGKLSQSKVVYVNFSRDIEQTLSVFPNPAKNNASIEFYSPRADKVSIEVYDLLGRKVYEEKEADIKRGGNQLSLDSKQWENGVYLIKLRMGGETYTTKLLKE